MSLIDGYVAEGFEPVRETFAHAFARGEELGAGFAVVIAGETKVELWGGHADRAETKPWTRDTLVPVFSTTKPIAALVAALLHDRGSLDLEAPIGDLWPAFSAHGKGAVSVAEALAHKAGVPGFREPIDPAIWLSPEACAEAVAALAPLWPPGSAHGYHPLTFGVIAGAIVREASGRSLGAVLREHICGPLNIDFHIGTPDNEHHRCAEIAKPKKAAVFGPNAEAVKAAFTAPWAAPARGGPDWRRAELPGANGHGTALAVAQLFQVLAADGVVAGRRLLGPDALRAWTTIRAEGPDLVLPFNLAHCAGVMRNSNRFYGPNPQAFGHSGWGGSCGFADPAHALSCAYVMNRQSHHLMGDPRTLALIEAVYRCV
jgi:CubicO group peptidase (beta-lactamase class C family)